MAVPDEAEFTRFYRHYVRMVHGRLYIQTNSRDVAEDLTAATFERAYNHRGGRMSNVAAPEHGDWLFGVADAVLAEFRRGRDPR